MSVATAGRPRRTSGGSHVVRGDTTLQAMSAIRSSRGLPGGEIAERLVLSLKTVESHLRRLFDRCGVMNRTELAVLSLREGWIAPGMPG